MALNREQLDRWEIRKFFPKEKSGARKWYKNQINRFIRHMKINEDSPSIVKKPYKGYEY